MLVNQLNFVHRFVAASTPETAVTILLLHGTGGNESDLLPLGKIFGSAVNLLSPRGKVLEQGMPRFFRRLAEGVFDLKDLKFRTLELAEFIAAAADHYHFDTKQVIAVGYSNGANIAASLLLLQPNVLAHAILLHPMVPLVPDQTPNLTGKKILITAGEHDPIVPATNTQRLASMLGNYGAKVQLYWYKGGHQLMQEELEQAKMFFSAL